MVVSASVSRLFIAYLLLTNIGLGQSTPAVQTPPIDFVPITTRIKKTVVFVQTDCRHIPTQQELALGTGHYPEVDHHSGTGFLAGVEDKRLNGAFIYLITNRHVIQPGIEDSKPCEVLGRFVRLNVKENSQAQNPIPFSVQMSWEFPTDPSVDLAALNWGPDPKLYDVQIIPTKEIIT